MIEGPASQNDLSYCIINALTSFKEFECGLPLPESLLHGSSEDLAQFKQCVEQKDYNADYGNQMQTEYRIL